MYILNLKVNSILFEIEVQTSKAKKFYFLPAFMASGGHKWPNSRQESDRTTGASRLVKEGAIIQPSWK